MSAASLLSVRALSAGYGRSTVLHDVDLEVGEGQIVALLGANGAGKTTTLRSICGLTTLRRGEISFSGQPTFGRSPEWVARLGLGHVPEGRGTFPNLTVEENLQAGGLQLPRREVQAELDRWYAFFPHLAQRRAQKGGSLSGGEQQMLAVARAMMPKPRLVLLDEPSMGLAPKITQALFEQLAEINQSTGAAMLIVEQNANLALKIASYVHVLESGVITTSGPAAQLADDAEIKRATSESEGEKTSVELFVQRLLDGLSNGSIYALLALAIVLAFMATGTFNLALGAIGMFSAFTTWWMVVHAGIPLGVAFVLGVLLGAVVGAILERVFVRPVENEDTQLPVIVVTLGLLLMLGALASTLYTNDSVALASIFPSGGVRLGSVTIQYQQIGILAVLAVSVWALYILFARTRIGLAMRATVDNPESSQLIGIKRGQMLVLGWALSGFFGALAGLLIAPVTLVGTGMLDNSLFLGFAAAAIGGFRSPLGAVLGGLLMGLAESLAPSYIPMMNNHFTLTAVFLMMLVVLLIKPYGIFGRPDAVRL